MCQLVYCPWEEKQETLQFPLTAATEPSVSDLSTSELEKLAQRDPGDEHKPAEEVTRLCSFPGCILFDEHDGNHEFPKPAAEPPKEKEKRKPKDKRGDFPHGHNDTQPGAQPMTTPAEMGWLPK